MSEPSCGASAFLGAGGPVAVPFRLCCLLTLLPGNGPTGVPGLGSPPPFPGSPAAECVVEALRGGRVAALAGTGEEPMP
jgi:hypothetical protein